MSRVGEPCRRRGRRRGVSKVFNAGAAEPGRRARRHRPRRRTGRVRLADRAVGMRQVDAAAADRQPHRADAGRRASSTASRRTRPASTRTTAWRSSRRACSTGAPSSENIELPLELRVGTRPSAGHACARDARARQAPRVRRRTCRGSCRAACSSASRSPARWPRIPRCC